MYFVVVVLSLLQYVIPNNAVMHCCSEPNIVVNKTCLDGSNVILTCKYRHLVGPTLKNPENIELDEFENLIISSDQETGFLKVERNMFCMTRNAKNTSDLAYVCYIEDEDDISTAHIVIFYIKIVCAALTFLFSLVTLIIYVFTKDLRDIEGKCVINFLAGLCIEHLTVMLLPVINSLSKNICNTTAFIYYTSNLYYFIWLNVISFHLWRLTVPIFRTQIKWFVLYCLYGFGVPLLVLATALTYHHMYDLEGNDVIDYDCLTLGSIGIWAYFYGPLLLLIIMTAVPLLWAAKRLWINIDRRETAQCVVRLRAKCRLFGHLIALMGSVLLIDVIMYSFHGKNEIMEYFWDALDSRNLAVGGAVFLILVVYRNKVLIALSKRGLFCFRFPDKWARLIDDEKEEKDNEEATLTPFTCI